MYDDSDESSDDNRQNNQAQCRRAIFDPKPHLVTIVKTNTGFGFNVKGQVSEGGQLRSLNGELYAPLQHVSAVLPNGAAERANLRRGDRILEVNGVNVEGATHRQVVDLIKHGGDKLTMIVISVPDSDVDRGLEQYVERVCSVRVIADSDIMQDFLMECDPVCEVDIRVIMPDLTSLTLTIRRNASTSLLFAMLMRKLNMSRDMAHCCALFETMEQGFERKLLEGESPHSLYVQNYSSASSSCLILRKWVFDIERERYMCKKDPLFLQFVYYQAVHDVNEGHIKSSQKMYHLKAMQTENNAENFLDVVRGMDGYNQVTFPHCGCAMRRDGNVVMVINFKSLVLKADPDSEVVQT
uniref:PDZ domain-containing protein n=1 Tax=Heterorhabditis bacteriophora TaxID=37862 RepID=A0A1I7XP05_HETBA